MNQWGKKSERSPKLQITKEKQKDGVLNTSLTMNTSDKNWICQRFCASDIDELSSKNPCDISVPL